jgi:hypothetical protein
MRARTIQKRVISIVLCSVSINYRIVPNVQCYPFSLLTLYQTFHSGSDTGSTYNDPVHGSDTGSTYNDPTYGGDATHDTDSHGSDATSGTNYGTLKPCHGSDATYGSDPNMNYGTLKRQ